MNKPKLLIIVMLVSLITACSLRVPTEIAGGVILASDKVDSMVVELGEHVENQVMLAELDTIQKGVLEILETGEDTHKLANYYYRSLIVYSNLKGEAVERWDELDDFQRLELVLLDNELVALNEKIIAYNESIEDKQDLISFIRSAVALITFYGHDSE